MKRLINFVVKVSDKAEDFILNHYAAIIMIVIAMSVLNFMCSSN